MTTDEAREAAGTGQFRAFNDFWASFEDADWEHVTRRTAFGSGYNAGVVEGRRQAREAVRVENRKFGGADGFDAIRVIDALGGEQ